MKKILTLFSLVAIAMLAPATLIAQCALPVTIVPTSNPGEVEITYDFTAVPNPNDFIGQVYFYNMTDGQYAWSGVISQSNNPYLVTLPTNGNYEATSTAIDTITSCTDTVFINPLVITNLPNDCVVSFSSMLISPNEVSFTAYIGYSGVSPSPVYTWDFGDGTSATGNPVNHIYPVGIPANYNVTLTVNDSQCDGSSSSTVSLYNPCALPVTITPTSNPGEVEIEYDFTSVPNPADYYGIVYFYNTTTGQSDWSGTITQGNNPHLFNLPSNGNYEAVSYSEDMANNCTDSSYTSTFTIAGMPNNCDVSFTPTYITSNEITFNANIGFGGVSTSPVYTWDFGDGTTGTGNPVNHVYAPGASTNYLVTLTVTDVNCTGTFTAVISAGTLTSCGTSAYVIPDTSPFPSATNNFAAYGSFGSGASTFWDFGDGNTSTSNPVNHTYNTSSGANTFQALFVVNDSVCTDSIYVTVFTGSNAQCESDFTLVQDSLNPGVYNGYNYSVSNGITSYFWDFGNGDTSTDQFPTYTYSSVGLYTICLTILSDAGCVDTLCMDIDILVKSGTTINILDPAQNLSIASQNTASTFAVYPNPSTGNFTLAIQSKKDEVYLVQLHDITGKVIFSENYPVNEGSNNLNIDLENSAAGIYFLNLNGEAVSKIVVE
ncbi:MAG: PKD domain-containing protein [Crocinitomicaceae bacterium]|nr:PKD domain-containing protein [Crocinitomicaceae bacterium]